MAFRNILIFEDALLSRQLLSDFSDDLSEEHELLDRIKPRSNSLSYENEADYSSNQMKPRSISSLFENGELSNLLNINESEKAKTKERSKGSQNKKGTMIKAEKKAANSTKRHLSGFELVERDIEQ